MTFRRPMVRSLGSGNVGHLCSTVLFDITHDCQTREKKTSNLQHKNSPDNIARSVTAELKKRRKVGYLASDVTWRGEFALITRHATCLHHQYKVLTVLNAQEH